MKVDKLHIRSRFKNLENVTVDFDEDNLMTVIVGQNGSGKSNVIEALVAIFRNLDLGEPPPFSYLIVYRLGQRDTDNWREITIDADPLRGTLTKQYITSVKLLETSNPNEPINKDNRQNIPFSQVKRDNKTGKANFLPNFLFAYYSGPSDRLEKYFRKHRDAFYKNLLYSKTSLESDIRPLFYAKSNHSQFVLMAFFLSKGMESERAFLHQHLGITGLDSIHFVIRKPEWAKARDKDDIFWGADGVVRDFLNLLYPQALAPVKVTRNENTSLTGKHIKNEFIHLFLPDLESLQNFAGNLRPDIFFKMLESTLLSEIISEVHIRVNVISSDTPLTFNELSEGEQQLLTVLGLLKFTGGKDSLFLLDEPDTHLNPSWAVKYLKLLREFVPNHETSHLLMVTHHPLAIAELEKQQVQVMWRDETHQAHAQEPEESPRGMGYAGILTSDMFGLRTSLDNPTEKLVRLRQKFTQKIHLSEIQKARLKKIDNAIKLLGFTTSHWDKEYGEYLRLRKQLGDEIFEKQSNPDVKRLREKRAKEIITVLLKQESERGE